MIASLTIDNLNPETLTRLLGEAERRGVDVNVLVKEIIQDRLGPVAKSNATQPQHDLDALAGTWSAEEAAGFLATLSDMRQCDEDLWR
jgi:hypothetical protein